MFRKALFGSLTVMLAGVLIWLIIKGRQQEARLAGPTEIVKTARSSSTRVVAPKDLEIKLDTEAGAAGRPANALGKVLIRNRGKETYHNVMLKLSFLGTGNKILGTQDHLVKESIEPGQELAAGEISADNAPAGSKRCDVAILYSELGPATGK